MLSQSSEKNIQESNSVFTALPEGVSLTDIQNHVTDFLQTTIREEDVAIEISPFTEQYGTMACTNNIYQYTVTPFSFPTITTLLDVALSETHSDYRTNTDSESDWPTKSPLMLRSTLKHGYTITVDCRGADASHEKDVSATVNEEYQLENVKGASDSTNSISVTNEVPEKLQAVIVLCEGVRYLQTHPVNTGAHWNRESQAPALAQGLENCTNKDVEAEIDDFYRELTTDTPIGWRVRWMVSALEDIGSEPSNIAAAAQTPVCETVFHIAVLTTIGVLREVENKNSITVDSEPTVKLTKSYINTNYGAQNTKHNTDEQGFVSQNVSASDLPRVVNSVFQCNLFNS